MLYLLQIVYTYVLFIHWYESMKKDDEASPSIILAGRALLVKMLILFYHMVHVLKSFLFSIFGFIDKNIYLV